MFLSEPYDKPSAKATWPLWFAEDKAGFGLIVPSNRIEMVSYYVCTMMCTFHQNLGRTTSKFYTYHNLSIQSKLLQWENRLFEAARPNSNSSKEIVVLLLKIMSLKF